MVVRSQSAKERCLLLEHCFHGANLRAAQHQDQLRLLEMNVPGILERGEHRGIGLYRPGQLIQNQNQTLPLEIQGKLIPERSPAQKGGRVWREGTPTQGGITLPPLQIGRLFLGYPIAPGQATLAGLLTQERGLSHATTPIQHHQHTGVLARHHLLQSCKLSSAINEHKPSHTKEPSRTYYTQAMYKERALCMSG